MVRQAYHEAGAVEIAPPRARLMVRRPAAVSNHEVQSLKSLCLIEK
jgi:hypothetical protein